MVCGFLGAVDNGRSVVFVKDEADRKRLQEVLAIFDVPFVPAEEVSYPAYCLWTADGIIEDCEDEAKDALIESGCAFLPVKALEKRLEGLLKDECEDAI